MTRSPPKHDLWHPGPLAGHPRRRTIATSVRHGQAVVDPEDAGAAVAQAAWTIGNCEVGGLVALAVGVLAMTSGDAGWPSLAGGVLLVAFAVFCLALRLSAHRALTVNQELLREGGRDEPGPRSRPDEPPGLQRRSR